MAAPLTIQLNISNGVSSEEGPFARLLRVPGGEEGECLLAVAEAQGPEGAEVCDNALDYLSRAFAAGNLSISRRMLDGLKGIHQGLASDNRNSLPEHKVTLGIVLGFVRGEDLYLAQAGGANAYLIDNEGCHLLTTSGEGGGAARLRLGEEPASGLYNVRNFSLGKHAVLEARVLLPQAKIHVATRHLQDPHHIEARPALIAQMRAADLASTRPSNRCRRSTPRRSAIRSSRARSALSAAGPGNSPRVSAR